MYKIDDELKRELIQVARETGNEEAIRIIEEADDPVLWAERHLRHPDTGETEFKVKRQFKPFLRSNAKDRALRVGRQSGKTVHSMVDVLHTCMFQKNVIMLIFVTSIPLMNRMLTIISNLVKNTELEDSITRRQKGKSRESVEEEYDHAVYFDNGNKIYFFAMNKNPDKARGQYGTHIYVDEADFMPEEAWPVITGVIKRDPNIKLTVSSTPSGVSGSWFERFCKKCALDSYTDGAEFHLPTRLDDDWELIEPRLRASIHDEVTWALEVDAEFVEPKGAVYKREVVEESFKRWEFNGSAPSMESVLETLEYRTAQKFLGVDWNTPQNGVRIVELARMWGKLLLTRHIVVSYEEYTQLNAVRVVVDLAVANNYAMISVDEGYGATQIELLKAELSKRGYDVSRLINVVDSNKHESITIEYRSPHDGSIQQREYMKVKTKFRIVNLLGQYMETELALPPEVYDTLGNEIRNFRRKGKSGEGGFVYSENSHSLSALHVAIHGYDRYSREVGFDQLLDTYESFIATSQLPIGRQQVDDEMPVYHNSLTSDHRVNNHRTRGLYGTSKRTSGLK